jgi:hypothetical protein
VSNNIEVVHYDPATGELTHIDNIQPACWAAMPEHVILFSGATFKTHYVDINQSPPRVLAKTPITFSANKTVVTADGTDSINFTGLPVCTADFSRQQVAVTDGTFSVDVDLPGSYKVIFSGVPYLTTFFDFTAV